MVGLGGLRRICSWGQTQCLGHGGERQITGSSRPASSWGLTGFWRKNIVTAPTKGLSTSRGSRMIRSVPCS